MFLHDCSIITFMTSSYKRLICDQSVMSLIPVKEFLCFLQQETIPSLLTASYWLIPGNDLSMTCMWLNIET